MNQNNNRLRTTHYHTSSENRTTIMHALIDEQFPKKLLTEQSQLSWSDNEDDRNEKTDIRNKVVTYSLWMLNMITTLDLGFNDCNKQMLSHLL